MDTKLESTQSQLPVDSLDEGASKRKIIARIQDEINRNPDAHPLTYIKGSYDMFVQA